MKILQWFFEKLVGVDIESECGNFEGAVEHDLRSGSLFSWVNHEGHYYAVSGHVSDAREMLETWAALAANKKLPLDWMAASYICQMIREEVG